MFFLIFSVVIISFLQIEDGQKEQKAENAKHKSKGREALDSFVCTPKSQCRHRGFQVMQRVAAMLASLPSCIADQLIPNYEFSLMNS